MLTEADRLWCQDGEIQGCLAHKKPRPPRSNPAPPAKLTDQPKLTDEPSKVESLATCQLSRYQIPHHFPVQSLYRQAKLLEADLCQVTSPDHLSSIPHGTLEVTQGQILTQSPTDATRFWWHLYGS